MPMEWAQLQENDIAITRSELGVMNEVYFVTRVKMDGIREANKLVVRRNPPLSDADRITWSNWLVLEAGKTERIRMQMELIVAGSLVKMLTMRSYGRI